MTLDERIAARRAELVTRRAAVPDDGALPMSTTRDQLAEVQRQRAELDVRLRALDQATATHASLVGAGDEDVRWRDDLAACREALLVERAEIKSPIRDRMQLGRAHNLELSVRAIDFGRHVINGSGYALSTLRLGALLRERGYRAEGADPESNRAATMPWFGSLPDVEERIAALERRKVEAVDALEDALLSDEQRAKRDAERAARRAEANAAPRRKRRSDGSEYDKFPDGRVVEIVPPAAVEEEEPAPTESL